MKIIWTKERIDSYFKELREKLGYRVDFSVNIINENKIPVSIDIDNAEISVVLDFLNALDDESVKAHLGFAYVVLHKAEDENQYEIHNGRKVLCTTTQQCMDELCHKLNIEPVSVEELRKNNTAVRRKLYPCGHIYHSYFKAGDIIREGLCKYEIVEVVSEKDDILIRFKRIFPKSDNMIIEKSEDYIDKFFNIVVPDK